MLLNGGITATRNRLSASRIASLAPIARNAKLHHAPAIKSEGCDRQYERISDLTWLRIACYELL
jgi:hypothetical protein